MATFIDRHAVSSVPHVVRRRISQEARESRVDVHGARPLGHWLEDGWLYCVVEAPSIAAFCQHHVARGLDCSTIRRMGELHGTRPIPPEDDRRVRAAIQGYWHSPTTAGLTDQ